MSSAKQKYCANLHICSSKTHTNPAACPSAFLIKVCICIINATMYCMPGGTIPCAGTSSAAPGRSQVPGTPLVVLNVRPICPKLSNAKVRPATSLSNALFSLNSTLQRLSSFRFTINNQTLHTGLHSLCLLNTRQARIARKCRAACQVYRSRNCLEKRLSLPPSSFLSKM